MRKTPFSGPWAARLLLTASLLGGGASCLDPGRVLGQSEFEITIPTTLGDTTETFWLQIPSDYRPGPPRPLLIGWHQLGSDHNEMRAVTTIDSICDARGWIAASHDGVTPVHWNNHPTQSHVVDVIRWIEERYSIDPDRIYMVGASMGGAAGMVFSNNHLNPTGPMVAAAASVSGIQDCERRFLEQGNNNSMIASFGGRPEEVPFEYHRNSAIFFADSTQSMHFNALHLPLYLTFGNGASDQVWRQHAEDLYAVMAPYADEVILRESDNAGHGWTCTEAERTCDFLGSFVLDSHPAEISIQADEEGRWYWAGIGMRDPQESFARLMGRVWIADRHFVFLMIRNVSYAELDLPSVGFWPSIGDFTFRWDILDDGESDLILPGVMAAPALVLRDGSAYSDWSYDPAEQRLLLTAEGTGLYEVILDPADAQPTDGHRPAPPTLELSASLDGSLLASLTEAGVLDCRVFDPTGRQILAFPERWCPSGRVRLMPGVVPKSGVYFARAALTNQRGLTRSTRKFVILH